MPASTENTEIRVMRGTRAKVVTQTPLPGEPLFDLDNLILSIGDGATLGGKPINAMTSKIEDSIVDLNQLTLVGRYFLNAGMLNQPTGIESSAKCILETRSSDVGGANVFQSLYVISGKCSGHIYSRTTTSQGASWNPWISVSQTGFSSTGTGTEPGDTNINNYTSTSQVYIEGIANGPEGTDGSNGILITYTPDPTSDYIYQVLYVVSGNVSYQGKVYYRYSASGKTGFNVYPGYNWTLLDLHSFKTTPTADCIPRAYNDGKIDTGWIKTTDNPALNDSDYLVTSKALNEMASGKANYTHSHNLDTISHVPGIYSYTTSNSLDNGAITHIFISSGGPSASYGKNGDIWFQYI